MSGLPATPDRGTLVRTLLVTSGIAAACLAIGFIVTFRGPIMWDDAARIVHSRWLLGRFGLLDVEFAGARNTSLYAPAWELIMGIATEHVFAWLRDPVWVRHAMTLALCLWGLWATWALLRKAGVRTASATLAVASVIGVIRLGGHALFNVKDAPAAVVFLLVSVACWVLWKRALADAQPWPSLAALGAVSVLPFLVRVPLVLHYTLVVAIGFVHALWERDLPMGRRLGWAFIPGLIGLVLVVMLYPPFWTLHPSEWITPFARFGAYDFVGATRVLGLTFLTMDVPWWYALLWIPIIIHPLVLLLCLVGAFSPLKARQPLCSPVRVQTPVGSLPVSLRTWLWIVVALSWSAVLVKRPTLYDEERHLLFLYPPLVLVAALGLDGLRVRMKYLLSALVATAALASYMNWGKYAYVYKSPLIGARDAELFLGDYWGACIEEAVTALPDYIPPGAPVQVDGVPISAGLVEQRHRWGRWSDHPDFGPYRWLTQRHSPRPPFAAISFNRPYTGPAPGPQGMHTRHLQAVEAGRAQLLWSTDMPPDDTACVLVLYPPR